MLDKSLIGMVCKSSRVTNEAQITALRKAGAEWIVMEVHERGGTLVEVSTGRSSRNRGQRQAMVKDAAKALRRGNRTPPTGRGRGRPKKEWATDDVAKAKVVWFSRDYVTNVAAAKYLPKGMTTKRAWQLFGGSGRPYKQKRR